MNALPKVTEQWKILEQRNFLQITNSISHTQTVVQECCNGDEASQWKCQKFDPLATPKPLNLSSP